MYLRLKLQLQRLRLDKKVRQEILEEIKSNKKKNESVKKKSL